MLRLFDARTGKVSELSPARPGRLVIAVHPTADLRGQVFADVVRRLAERQRLHVALFSDQVSPDLNVRPGLSGMPESMDLGVGDLSSQRVLSLGRCLTPMPSTAEIIARGVDPLTLRLAILRRPYRSPLNPTWEELADAEAELRRRRDQVAEWARSPGQPMARQYAAAAEDRLRDDLDTPGALTLLDTLATDPDIKPGAKFETIVHIDLILGLDLVAHVGH